MTGEEKIHQVNQGSTAQAQGKRAPHNPKQSVKQEGKQISGTKIIYLAIALAIVGFVLLYASGILDGGSSPASAQQQGSQSQAGNQLANVEALNAQEELVKNNPSNFESLLSLAHMYNDAGFYQKAIEKYKVYLASRPNEPDVIVDMGVCYFNLEQHQEAIKNFKKGIELNPKHQIAHLNLGVVYNFGLNNKAEAVKWWKKAVELGPATEIGKRAQDFLNQNK